MAANGQSAYDLADHDGSDSEVALALGEDGLSDPVIASQRGQRARKWVGAALVVVGVMGLAAAILSTSEAPSAAPASTSDTSTVRVAPKLAKSAPTSETHASEAHAESVPWHKAPAGSTWSVGTAPIGTVHADARPRALTVAEFMQTSKFSSQMADQVRRLKERNFDVRKRTYSNPDEQVLSHKAAAKSISSFLDDLSRSHPKVAMMLHNMKLDDEQQEVVHNSIHHLTSEKTMQLGSEVMTCAVESTFQGKDAFKKHLQAKLGKGLKPLYDLRSEIFPKHFDPEQKSSIQLKASEVSGDDPDTARLHILRTSESRFGGKKSARRLQGEVFPNITEPVAAPEITPEEPEEEEEEEKVGPVFIVKLTSSVLASVVTKIITLAIPSKVGEILAMSLESIEAIVDCVTMGAEKYGWIECAVHGVGAALEAVTVFTKKEEGEKKDD
eukprot:gnl/TRDRNA2_/TRDRNA2_35496_c0_seq1.p1 gnl/TRDRNA2_/TRDRNA2_35496_c0~~gnl/TRDRNA2_/TRDRNA2_35496_c0_seq1.p1  ORF type:complete len:442 (+),score=101.92 gnl/TRDRNA2_/TRDRNA2_35496_c0_seq1:30-1355(+)